jgi:hypothetical protein
VENLKKNLLFIDIETVPLFASVEDLPVGIHKHWQKKCMRVNNLNEEAYADNQERLYRTQAGVYAEFARVCCIGLGMFMEREGQWYYTQKMIGSTNEVDVLNKFSFVLERLQQNVKNVQFVGHNIKEFDLPFLGRRFLANKMRLPNMLNMQGKKPWEILHIDTLELWKFGDYKHYIALDLLAHVLGVPTSKDDIDGSQVADVFYEEHNLERIQTYCLKDVLTTAKVYWTLTGGTLEQFPPVWNE